jgi:hypothetical protein
LYLHLVLDYIYKLKGLISLSTNIQIKLIIGRTPRYARITFIDQESPFPSQDLLDPALVSPLCILCLVVISFMDGFWVLLLCELIYIYNLVVYTLSDDAHFTKMKLICIFVERLINPLTIMFIFSLKKNFLFINDKRVELLN